MGSGDVRSTPESGSRKTPMALLLCAISGSRDADGGAVHSINSRHWKKRQHDRPDSMNEGLLLGQGRRLETLPLTLDY